MVRFETASQNLGGRLSVALERPADRLLPVDDERGIPRLLSQSEVQQTPRHTSGEMALPLNHPLRVFAHRVKNRSHRIHCGGAGLRCYRVEQFAPERSRRADEPLRQSRRYDE